MRNKAISLFKQRQEEIKRAIEELELQSSAVRFVEEAWKRPDAAGGHGGGGVSKILRGGKVFEQAAVNFSEVSGILPKEMASRLINKQAEADFFATGVSVVFHPLNPYVPTVHCNFRFLEVDDYSWFGGGADLTPYYFFQEDAVDFHRNFEKICNEFSPDYYPKFKKQCDEYFYLPHRKEARGIGGVFFDYLGKGEAPEKLENYFRFSEKISNAFISAYLPIVEKRKNTTWGEREREFQLIRRGRYVEFNLVHDRGTLFGLKTNGRTESILASLPPLVRWDDSYSPETGSPEEVLLEVISKPRDWL